VWNKGLGVSSAFLSKVEHGDKEPSKEWRGKIIETYRLDGDKIAELDGCLSEAINSESK